MPKPLAPIINGNNPSTRGLIFNVPFFERGGANVKDLLSTNFGMTGSPAWSNNVFGSKVTFNGTSQDISFGGILLSPIAVTACMLFEVTAIPSGNFEISFGYDNTRWFLIWNGASTKLGFNVKIATVEKQSGYPATGLSLNTPYLAFGTYDPNASANNLTISVWGGSGLIYNLSSTQTGNMDSSANPLQVAHSPGRGFFNKMDCSFLAVWNRALPLNEQSSLYKNLWQIYKTPFQSSLNTGIFR